MISCRFSRAKGFTLIEMITVMVILSIVAVIGVQFTVSVMEGYNTTVNRGKLIAHGRQALERMSRELRIALPNSVRVTNSGQCVEFLPVVAGGNYIDTLPDQQNGAAAISSFEAGNFTMGLGSARYLYVGALTDTEIYGGSDVSSAVASTASTSVTLTVPHQFLRNSITRRFFLVDNPAAFCLSGGVLNYHSGYATPSTTNGTPSGSGVLIAEGVSSASPFLLSLGSEDRNSLLSINLTFSRAGESVTLNQEVFVRNVP